jgi:hypothetical protein
MSNQIVNLLILGGGAVLMLLAFIAIDRYKSRESNKPSVG